MARLTLVHRSYQLWLTTKARFSPTERQRLFGLTITIGGVCGLVAVAFHQSIRLVERLTIERAYAANGQSWVVWAILVPSLGALLSGLMLSRIPGARGSGGALDLMISSGLRELPVVDLDGRVLGLVDEADITREFMRMRAADRSEPGSTPS